MNRIVITGANRGIGLELCRQYCRSGDEVIAICRTASADLKSLPLSIIEGIDVAKNCRDVKESLAQKKIDILINNAGILRVEDLADFNFETMLEQFEINALGALKMTQTLLDNLAEGSKIIMITSRMGSIEDNERGGHYGYRMSKAALNAASVSLARDLTPRQIAVGIIHPGYVRTDMTGHNGMIEPSESVAGIIARIAELSLKNSGTFWHSNGEILPW